MVEHVRSCGEPCFQRLKHSTAILVYTLGMAEGNRKPAGRPKLGPQAILPIDGLHLEGDGNHDIRECLRGGQELMPEGKTEDISACVAASNVLQPLITRMSMAEHKPLPVVEKLRDEVEKVYLVNKRGQTHEDQPDVISASWRIRKLLGFLKMKCRRREVSSVPFLHKELLKKSSDLSPNGS